MRHADCEAVAIWGSVSPLLRGGSRRWLQSWKLGRFLQHFLSLTLAPLRSAMAGLLVTALAACSTSQTLQIAPPPQIIAPVSGKYSAIVVDGNTGSVLYDADSTATRFPASLTKMMTLYLLFEAMDARRVGIDTEIPVSAYAASRPPTKIGFRPGETVDVDSAIRALVTKSANDVAVAIGEYLGGTEEQFAQTMTAKARSIGMRSTVFHNASGLPDDEQRTTARDMAVLGLALRKRFPAQYVYFSNQTFMFRGRMVKGHNKLIGRVDGVDGIKTGYIRASGFNVVTSVNRGGHRLVVVVMGGHTARERDDHVEALIETYMPRATPGTN